MFISILESVGEATLGNRPAQLSAKNVVGLPSVVEVYLTIHANTVQSGQTIVGKFWPALTFSVKGKLPIVVRFFAPDISPDTLLTGVNVRAIDVVNRFHGDVINAICSYLASVLAARAVVRVKGSKVCLTLHEIGTFEGSMNASIETLAVA